jgi:hypothetical protein
MMIIQMLVMIKMKTRNENNHNLKEKLLNKRKMCKNI